MSLQGIDPRAARPFVRAISLVGTKFVEREAAKKDLSDHIDKLKEFHKRSKKKPALDKHVDILKQKMNDFLRKERQILGYSPQDDEKIIALEKRIDELEQLLDEERHSKTRMEAKHKDEIRQMKKTFAFLKSKLIEYITEKKERHKKLDAIHQQITGDIPENHYSSGD